MSIKIVCFLVFGFVLGACINWVSLYIRNTQLENKEAQSSSFGASDLFICTLTSVFFGLSTYLGNLDYIALVKMLITASILALIISIHINRANIPDSLLVTLAICGVLFGFLEHREYTSLIVVPIFSFVIAWILRYLSKFFLGDKQLSVEDVRLFLIAGFFIDIDVLPSFFVTVALYSAIVAAFINKLSLERPYTIAICIAIFTNFSHKLDILSYF